MKCQFRVTGFMKEVTYVLITLTVYILVGASRSYLAFLFHQLDFRDSRISIDDEQKSWIASSLGMLTPIGCLFSGTIMDLCGRKLFLLLMFIPFIISWIVISFATSFEMLFCGMFIQGIGLGMSFCVSTYISELCTPDNRGPLLGLTEVAYNVGVMFCNILMYNLPWNVVAVVFVVSSVVFMFLMLLLPESPIWLFTKGKRDKSIKALCSLRCSEIENLTDEMQDMENSAAEENKTTFCTTVKNVCRAWKPLFITMALIALLQHTGYSIMIAYTIMIFDRFRLPLDGSKFTIAYSVVGFIGSVATPFFMHKMGRKSILALSSFGMGVCVVVVAVYEEIFYDQSEKIFPYIVTIAFYVYTLACNIGVLPIGFIVGGELFPNEVRGIMNGLYGAFAYMYWSATLKVYPKFMITVGIKVVLWVFAASCFVVTLFGAFILPETRGKTLNEVQEQYFKKKQKKTAEKQDA